jgi:hypothetical protein
MIEKHKILINEVLRNNIGKSTPDSGSNALPPSKLDLKGDHKGYKFNHKHGDYDVYHNIKGYNKSTFLYVHPKTNEIHYTVKGNVRKLLNGMHVMNNLYMGPKRPEFTSNAADAYHDILKKTHVDMLVADNHSFGASKVWYKMSNDPRFHVYAWNPTDWDTGTAHQLHTPEYNLGPKGGNVTVGRDDESRMPGKMEKRGPIELVAMLNKRKRK